MNAIKSHLERSAEVKAQAAEECADAAAEAAEFVATLDHARPRPGLRALALTTDTSFLTAYSNDFGYQDIFARQVETLGRSGDVLIGISTSGNSCNVVAAIEKAKSMGMKTIALTGASGGKLKEVADLTIAVPADQTALIQENHIALGHAITASVETALGY